MYNYFASLFAIIVLCIVVCVVESKSTKRAMQRNNESYKKSDDSIYNKLINSIGEDNCKKSSKYICNESKYIFYQRERGGFNNVRIAFEDLVALAILTDRILIIPKKSNIDHITQKVDEFSFYSKKCLEKYVCCMSESKALNILKTNKLTDIPWGTNGTNSKNQITIKDLEKNKSHKIWRFTHNRRLFIHFFCFINKLSNTLKNKVVNGLVGGLKFREKYIKLAARFLHKVDIVKPFSYNAIHIRRGDFKDFNKDREISDKQLIENIKYKFSNKIPLLIISDDLPKGLKAVLLKSNYDIRIITNNMEKIKKFMGDFLACVLAKKFVGTDGSTFSTGIMHYRGVFDKKYPSMIELDINYYNDADAMESCNDCGCCFQYVNKKQWSLT